MDRERLNLNGNWKFMVSSAQRLSPTTMLDMESIRVPSCWETELPGLVAGAQMAWYQRTFHVPIAWLERAVVLYFGAVNYYCQVYVNGKLAGDHEGGYTPFSFRIDSFLQQGENLLEVAVTNPAAAMTRFPYDVAPEHRNSSGERMNLEEIPYGKQSWYGSGSGIWQGVWVEVRETCHIARVVTTPDVDRSEARVLVQLSEGARSGWKIAVEICQLDPDPIDNSADNPARPAPPPLAASAPSGVGDAPETTANTTAQTAPDSTSGSKVGTPRSVKSPATLTENPASRSPRTDRRTYRTELTTPRNGTTYELTIPMPGARLWSPDAPIRYRVAVSLWRGQDRHDAESAVFGMRKIEAKDGKIFLNNREIYIIGALDQDFYPGTLYIPPSDEFIEDQFTKAKELGLNLLRCHIKVPDPRYLYVADRLGLLVWAEVPNWWTLTQKAMERAQLTIEAMIERDFNHPCLIIWTIVNEDWGTNLSYSPIDRQWLKSMYHHVKKIDPTRLVVDNSACIGNLHVESDIEDFHVYYSIPDHFLMWRGWVRDFSSRARWTYSQYGDAVRTYQEPLIVSEFGNWGLPSIRGLRETYGTDPSWMTTGQSITYPYGTERRYAQYKLDEIFGSYDSFAEATQWHQFRALKFEIEEMRRYGSIVGYVVTEFTDIHWESNGLLDMVRRRKSYHNVLRQINSEDIVVPDWVKVNYWSGEEIQIPLLVSHYSWADVIDASVTWKLGDTEGRLDGISLAPATVESAGSLSLTAPDVVQAQRSEIQLQLQNGDGRVLNQNTQELFVFPPNLQKAPSPTSVWVHDPRDVCGLRASLASAGYRVTSGPSGETACCIALRFDREVCDFAEAGGNVICLAKPQTLKGRNGVLQEEGADLFNNGSVLITSRTRRPGEKISSKPWDGDWATNFNWLKFEEVCPNLVKQNPLGFEFVNVMPDYVILGYEAEEDFQDIYSGMVVGWVHSPVALMTGARYGKGRVLICTFKLEEVYGVDPVATVMLHDLVEFTCSKRFQPRKEAVGSVRMTAFMKALTEG